ncbi:hypothetical protein SAMN05660462_00347 [Proteiniborus ethanoligenes]|uniref:HTH cro/C1-type domain-containing protein n=1 Tax=Proteiniborus ethanoligenes TaxID=415015 RepID=A0A1H3KWF7_9FIRM|nr:helix-turn-helix transcriptional regulator [Proteiniborus ethanoligenes]SDY56471.1 hypothetical protein SAMN05660462_00347 [Proteiniborus ethanoligenes]
MKSCLEFGECLKLIVSSLNITYNQLARGINVDPSLVSKWINNKRVPPYNSNHIQNIAKFISSTVSSSQQERNINEVMKMISNEKSITFRKVEDKIEDILLNGQEYSIEQKNKIAVRFNSNYMSVKTSKAKPILINGSNNIFPHNNDHISTSHTMCSECMITGEEYILSNILRILDEASTINGKHQEPILIILNSGVELIPFKQDFYRLVEKLFIKILENDWQIVINLLLHDNKGNTLKTLGFIQKFIRYESFKVFYFKENSPQARGTDIIIVPTIGAMVCLTDFSHYNLNNAFYFKNQEIINTLLYHHYRSISHSSPLIVSRFYYRDIFFCKSKTENIDRLGNSYFYSDGINSLTIPLGLYNKYLKIFNTAKLEIEEKNKWHETKLNAFSNRVKTYIYRDIYIREEFENMIDGKKPLTIDGYKTSLEHSIDKNDIIRYVHHLIYLLKKYNNYEIALISKKNKNLLPCFFFEINGVSSLFINACNPLEKVSNIPENQRSAFSFLFNEHILVKAINEHFLDAWKSIPDINKNKNYIIAWLENILEKLKQ